MSLDEIRSKLAQAQSFKSAGNDLYKSGKHLEAAKKYHRAVLYLKGIDADIHGGMPFPLAQGLGREKPELTPELESECIATNIAVYNNLAASMLLIPGSDMERIVHYSSVVIELDSINEKAWYRKGQALMQLRKFEEAKEALLKSSSLGPASGKENKIVQKLVRDCDIEIEKNKKREKDMCRNMFK